MLGRKFGRLLVLSFADIESGELYWNCICDCGGRKRVAGTNLRAGHIQSCSCLIGDVNRDNSQTHGLSKSPEYSAFHNAKTRCNNTGNSDYPGYGGRGIKFLYRTFEEFYLDLGPRPSPLHTLDRENNDGNYVAGNCRWATRKEQLANRRVMFIGEQTLLAVFGQEGTAMWKALQEHMRNKQ
jgi:hypothetical protein